MYIQISYAFLEIIITRWTYTCILQLDMSFRICWISIIIYTIDIGKKEYTHILYYIELIL